MSNFFEDGMIEVDCLVFEKLKRISKNKREGGEKKKKFFLLIEKVSFIFKMYLLIFKIVDLVRLGYSFGIKRKDRYFVNFFDLYKMSCGIIEKLVV